jgi:predicted amidohydrolase YtcJ
MLQRENHRRAIIFAADGVGYARHMSEEETGIIKPDKFTNFIVINQILLEIPPQKCHMTEVFTTAPEGHTVYRAEQAFTTVATVTPIPCLSGGNARIGEN